MFDTVGPIASTVEDCTLILSALTARRAADLKGASLANARFGVLDTVALEDVREAPARGFEDAVRRMANAGEARHDEPAGDEDTPTHVASLPYVGGARQKTDALVRSRPCPIARSWGAPRACCR